MKPEEMKIFVKSVGWQGTWGKGDTLEEALKNAKKPKDYMVYIAHPDTRVMDDGGFRFPSGYPPKKIHSHEARRPKKKKV